MGERRRRRQEQRRATTRDKKTVDATGEECESTVWALERVARTTSLEAELPLWPQLPRYSYLPPSLSPSSSLGRKVCITHARKLAQHPWYVPGAYVNSEAASPAISGPAALVASSGSRSIPHVWLSRCRAGPVRTAATDSIRIAHWRAHSRRERAFIAF